VPGAACFIVRYLGQNCSDCLRRLAQPASRVLGGAYQTEANMHQFVRSQNVTRHRHTRDGRIFQLETEIAVLRATIDRLNEARPKTSRAKKDYILKENATWTVGITERQDGSFTSVWSQLKPAFTRAEIEAADRKENIIQASRDLGRDLFGKRDDLGYVGCGVNNINVYAYASEEKWKTKFITDWKGYPVLWHYSVVTQVVLPEA
jgi:hypothetical protein